MVTRHRYCEHCGACVECDPDELCWDYGRNTSLPATHHYAPFYDDGTPYPEPVMNEPVHD